jgi:hypothetical protein
VLGHEHERLPVEPRELHGGADKASSAEIEGNHAVFSYAIQTSGGPESQTPRPAEADGAIGREDTHELPGGRVIFTHARHGAWALPRFDCLP